MGIFDFNAPQSSNMFAHGVDTGVRTALGKAAAENDAQRTQLMSEEMRQRLIENARRIGKEESKDRINLLGSTAMAARLAEQEGRDPNKVWSQGRSTAIQQYPEMASMLPEQYDPDTAYALLGQSAEAMDVLAKMQDRKEDREFRREMTKAELADKAEYRNLMREQSQESRDFAREKHGMEMNLMNKRIEGYNSRYGASGKPNAAGMNKQIDLQMKIMEDMDPESPEYEQEKEILNDLIRQHRATFYKGGAPQKAPAEQPSQSGIVMKSAKYGDVTEDDIQETMRQTGMTREAVLKRLGE